VLPRHKKYEPAGKKAQLRTSQLWLDQADARELHNDEEFTLMDWGNAIVKVCVRRHPLAPGLLLVIVRMNSTGAGLYQRGRGRFRLLVDSHAVTASLPKGAALPRKSRREGEQAGHPIANQACLGFRSALGPTEGAGGALAGACYATGLLLTHRPVAQATPHVPPVAAPAVPRQLAFLILADQMLPLTDRRLPCPAVCASSPSARTHLAQSRGWR